MDNESNHPCIQLNEVSKIYNGTTVIDEVSMVVGRGSATALIGRNGSGKSTLLSILSGLIQVSTGEVRRSERKMVIGYAPEFFPGLKFTPEEFLRSIGRIHGLAPTLIEHRIAELLACFRLESFRSRTMVNFSKGMLQKMNLMQSLLAEPSLLLLDEPMSGLDAPAQEALVKLVGEMRQKGTGIVFSIHEPQWIEAMADGVHVLQTGRTVRTMHRSELQSSSYSHIIFKGILHNWIHKEINEMPGFLSVHSDAEDEILNYTAISVQTSCCDVFLREILDAGGSIISVERRGGLSGLEAWMSPKASFTGGHVL